MAQEQFWLVRFLKAPVAFVGDSGCRIQVQQMHLYHTQP